MRPEDCKFAPRPSFKEYCSYLLLRINKGLEKWGHFETLKFFDVDDMSYTEYGQELIDYYTNLGWKVCWSNDLGRQDQLIWPLGARLVFHRPEGK